MDEGQVKFQVDPRKMKVTLAIAKPDDIWKEPVLPEELEAYLKQQGVICGVDHNALVHLATSMIYDKEIVVAQGKEPQCGDDGYYEFLVDLEDKKEKPLVAEDGTVDYLNSLKIAMVEAGQVIAVYHPATVGIKGITVFGDPIPAMPGRNMPALKGKGIEETKEGNTYVAKTSGRIYKDDKRICIDPIYVVPGDLGINYGNIKFNGDVEIRGDMHSGLEVDAEGSIFIRGHVGNCKLKAGKNVTIGKGIQGKYGCEIVAGGDVAANFVEHCNITAQGSIYANSILNSNVHAKESVVVTSREGKIIGGNTTAIQSIRVKNVGNEAGVRTRLIFGETVELITELLELKKRQKKVQMDLSILEEKTKVVDKLGPKVAGEDTVKVKRQIAQAKILRQTEDTEIGKEIAKREDMIRRAKESANVHVTGVIYHGVVLSCDGAATVQEDAMRDVVFVNRSNHIVRMSPEEYEA